ncbi:polysaccharide ABC transporter ATP-binding protein [Longimicrobium terrae]|uniref:Lipopolysaccharide transport system ATP-binding protein n=1 Tax=Longimicrobium terrae TaxID=1639882 RepID=A0A841GWH3_9BACT|nr:polysaccharide ABC transporter ATP-binding protein [Longimicrobium terrae]MBB4634494.1 lipopolysaccharide transport system ATP-binding protein [Longimicrobium terrae]MBB6068616.1 lipopolysaccharide transport system ATP-binding protein [Longimicrobium terrae]NNC27802.1 ATP-binding cassette domain-containing protein [Longimicrobium terrae]
MQSVVQVQHLSKRYQIGARPVSRSLREALGETMRAPLAALRRGGATPATTLWALDDVNFEIAPGEVVGFIGHNGAGKSTLLKVLSRIVAPTRGRVELRGRVGSLLEVGTGFHPELTGRENVFLNGAVLGMRRAEIAAKFDEIVAFAEVDRFIDTPVKRYSSGMYMRLAFAVSAHLEPEIMIVDEVLAVGDLAFQKKCLGKMGDVARHGRTILFVSHNMQAIANLCTRALLMQGGRVEFDGPTLDAIGLYHRQYQVGSTRREYDGDALVGDDELAMRLLAVRQEDNETGSFESHLPVQVEMEVRVGNPPRFEGLVIGFAVFNENQVELFSSYFDDLDPTKPGIPQPGVYRLRCEIPAHFLPEGTFRLVPDVGISKVRRVAGEEQQLQFSVNNVRGVGSRWELSGWRSGSALLPYLPWENRVEFPAAADAAVSG